MGPSQIVDVLSVNLGFSQSLICWLVTFDSYNFQEIPTPVVAKFARIYFHPSQCAWWSQSFFDSKILDDFHVLQGVKDRKILDGV